MHELEKFPVHSLGLASLFSDPSAKTSEEALAHIFCEARRTTPSILYLPQFHIWWDTVGIFIRIFNSILYKNFTISLIRLTDILNL